VGARTVIQLAIVIALVVLALRQVDLADVRSALSRVNWQYASLALAVSFGSVLVRSYRWWLLLGADRTESFVRVTRALVVGQFANAGLPLRVGDVARVALLGAGSRGAIVRVGVTVIVERCLDGALLAGGLAYIAVGLGVSGWTSVVGKSAVVVVIAAPVVVAAACAFPAIRRRLARFARTAAGPSAVVGAEPTWPRLERHAAVLVIGLSGVIFAASIAINALVGAAVGVSLPLIGWVLVFVAVTLGAPVPAPPLRIGVFEALCWLALIEFNVPLADAITYGILLHVVAFVWPIAGGSIVLLTSGYRRPEVDTTITA
jgi:uncharacterized membrane protein YbhN (UPF0104 family)